MRAAIGARCCFSTPAVTFPESSSRNSMCIANHSMLMDNSHGRAMTAVKRPKVSSGTAATASRFVRLDTGSNRDAVLARCAVAYRCGSGRASSRLVVVRTIGVSRTMVVSRLRTAVVTDATMKTHNRRRFEEDFAWVAMSSPE